MRYTSTRGHDIDCSFEEAITQGYAADGGLFVPRSLPILTGAMLNEWSKLTYPQLLGAVVRLFISRDEVTDKELQTVCESAMDGFADPSHAVPIVPLKAVVTDKTSEVTETATESSTVQDESSATFYVAELFHGPTFCFKDLGMRAVIQLLSLFATKRQRPITLLVSTTGDTGPAAVRAVADLPSNRDINDAKSAKVDETASAARIKIAVHYPHEQISDFQRRQMTTVVSPSSVRVVAFEGGGDDMDVPIKNLLASKDKSNLSSSVWTGVNSYNIGRPIMQMILYIWTYLRVAERHDWAIPNEDCSLVDSSFATTMGAHTIDIILPTGAMGNIAAGFMARQMGLPIATLIAAVNINDIVHSAVTTGAFHRRDVMHRTLSEAINIQVPYNFERLLYYLTNANADLVQSWYQDLAETGRIDLDDAWLSQLQRCFASARVTDAQMCHAAATVHADYQYLADPHTAVAFAAAYQHGYLVPKSDANSREKFLSSCTGSTHTANEDFAKPRASAAVLLATASPCKFETAVVASVGERVWADYCESNAFPLAAKNMLLLPEQPLTRYTAIKGRTLAETQLEWEDLARKVVADLEQTT